MRARPLLPAAGAALVCAALLSAAPAGAAERPRIGLVLGGGGARGAAHIGVLELLEELRVPVDCVAGTSMGALVAGAWAAGLDPARMRQALAQADWADMFNDDPVYNEFAFRNKRLSQRFLLGPEAGIKAGGAETPPGVVSGQKIKLFFNRLVHADAGEPMLERLPLPVSIIATDIGNGERVVLRDGSLTQAMRASMSVPGLLAPLEYRGRKLVDGGLVDNLPIGEVHARCAADVVIAVNVGSPLLRSDQVSGLLGISAQVIALLTEQNVQASLAGLRLEDIYVQPDLGGIGAGDFERSAEAAARGRAAAEALRGRLATLGVDAAAYARWRAGIAVHRRDVPRIDEVQIAGLERVGDAAVRRHVRQRAGAPLERAVLEEDVLRIYGDGWYERVDYEVLGARGRTVLRVLPVEKSWGPDYLRLGVHLESSLSRGSSYLLRLGYQKTWINPLGGELLVSGDLGSRSGVGVEWFQPLEPAQRLFFQARGAAHRVRSDWFYGDRRIAEYSTAQASVEADAGLAFARLGQLRLGWRERRTANALETGVDLYALEAAPTRSGGWLLAADFDRFDRLYFPRSGWSAQAEWYHAARRGYTRAALDLRSAWPLEQWVMGGRASWVGSPAGVLPVNDAGKLGGFLNLTAYTSGQLVGDDVAYAQLRAERIVGRLPLGLRGDMRLGVALEAGKVGMPYARQARTGWLPSLALYVGGETPLGPAYLGIGRGLGGALNAYLFVGTP
ncbi:MAG: patatin [Pseudomonadota bacterium]|nr:patatin-like phospholipase family protein [Rubrivivax sp.]